VTSRRPSSSSRPSPHRPKPAALCAKGHLDSQKKETAIGSEIYLVTPQSVAQHIAQIEELNASDIGGLGVAVGDLLDGQHIVGGGLFLEVDQSGRKRWAMRLTVEAIGM